MSEYNEKVNSNGKVYFNFPEIQTGKYYLTIDYLPNEYYRSCSAQYKVYVNMQVATGILETENDILDYYNDDILYAIAKFYLGEEYIINGNVTFYIDDTKIGTGLTNLNGEVSVTSTIDIDEEGEHLLLAKLSDGSDYRGCTLLQRINIWKKETWIVLDELGETYYEEDFTISGTFYCEENDKVHDISMVFVLGDSFTPLTRTLSVAGTSTPFSFDFKDQLYNLPQEFMLTVSTPGNKYLRESSAEQLIIIKEHVHILCNDEYDVLTEGVTIKGRVSRRSTDLTYNLSSEYLKVRIPYNNGTDSDDNPVYGTTTVNVEMDVEGNFVYFYSPNKGIPAEHDITLDIEEGIYHDGTSKTVLIHDYSQTDITIGDEDTVFEYGIYDTFEIPCSITSEDGDPLLSVYGSDCEFNCSARVIEYTEDLEDVREIFKAVVNFDPSSTSFIVSGDCENDETGGKRLLEVYIEIVKDGEVVYSSRAYKTLRIFGYITGEFTSIHTEDGKTEIPLSMTAQLQQNGGDVFSDVPYSYLWLRNDDTGDIVKLANSLLLELSRLSYSGAIPVNTYPYESTLMLEIPNYEPTFDNNGWYYGTMIESVVYIPQPTYILPSKVDYPEEKITLPDMGVLAPDGNDHEITYFVNTIYKDLPAEQGYVTFTQRKQALGTDPTGLTLTLDKDEVVYGNAINIQAELIDCQLNPIQEAEIEFSMDDVVFAEMNTTTKGIANRNYTPTKVGEHEIKAYFGGDNTNAESYDTKTINVTQQGTNMTLELTSTDIYLGETIDVTAHLYDQDDQPLEGKEVKLYDDDTLFMYGDTDSEGKFVYESYKPSTAGSHTFMAKYEGDNILAGSTATATCQVTQNTTSMQLSYGETDITMLETVEVEITLKDVNGKGLKNEEIVIYEDNTIIDVIDINSGDIYTYKPTCSGEHTITISYEGNGVNTPAEQSFTVNAVKVDTMLDISPRGLKAAYMEIVNITQWLVYGEDIPIIGETLKTYVAGSLKREDVTDENGEVNWRFQPQVIGEYDLEVVYEGSEVFNGCNVSIPCYVGMADSLITIGDLPEEVDYGEEITFDIHVQRVSGDNLTNISEEAVKIYVNDKLITTELTSSAGYISYTMTMTTEGLNTIKVVYGGNDYITGSTAIVEISVGEQVKTTILEVNGQTSDFNVGLDLYEEYPFYVYLKGFNTGEVDGQPLKIYVDGVKVTQVDIEESSAYWSYIFEEEKDTEIMFLYEGDETHTRASVTCTAQITDNRGTITLIPAQQTYTIYYGDILNLYGTIETDPVLNDMLSFEVYDNGVFYDTLNSDQYATEFGFDYTGKVVETHLISIIYDGDTKYKPTSTTITVTVLQQTTNISVDEGTSVSCYVTEPCNFNLKLESNKGVLSGETISILDNEGYYKEVTTGNDGYGQFTYTPSSVGLHTLSTNYAGSYGIESSNNNIQVTALIIPTTMTYTTDTKFTVGLDEEVTVGAKITEQYQNTTITSAEYTVYDNGTKIGTTTNGIYNFSSNVLGSHTVRLVYEGTDIYEGNELIFTVDIISLETSILVDGGVTKTGYVNIQQDFRIGLVSGGEYLEGQTIELYEDGTFLTTIETGSDGYTTYTYSSNIAGSHIITIVYNGTTIYTECTETINMTTSKVPIYTLDLSVPEDPCYYGENVVVVWQIYSDITNYYKQSGTCQYYVDDEYVGDMSWYVNRPVQFSCVLDLSCGTHTIKLVSLEDDMYEELVEEFTFTLLKHPTSIKLTSDFTTLIQYNTYEFYVSVIDELLSEYLEGQTVEFYDNGELLGLYNSTTSDITIQWTPQDTGTHTIRVVYSETDIYEGYELTFTLRVIAQYTTEIELGDIPESIEYTEPLEITWKLKALNEDGSFKEYLTDETGLMSIHRNNYSNRVGAKNNGYYYDYVGDTAGDQNFVITYEGCDEYLPCNKEFLLVTTPMEIDVKYLSMTEEPWYVGDTVDLTFNVISKRTGETLTHYNRGDIMMLDYSTPQWLTYEDTDPVDIGDGTWQVSIVFEKAKTIDWGAYIMPISEMTMALEEPQLTNTIYKKGTEIELIDTPSDVSAGEQFRIQCKLRSLDVNGSFIEYLSGEEVTITFEDNKENMDTSSNSYYKDYTLDAGSYSFLLEYGGSDEYLSCSTTWSLDIEKSRLVIGDVDGEDVNVADNRDLRDYAFLHDTYLAAVLLYSETEDKYVQPPEFYFYINGAEADYPFTLEDGEELWFLHYLAYSGDYEVRLVVPESTTYYEFDEVVWTFTVYKIPTLSHFTNGETMLVYDTQQLESETGNIIIDDFIHTIVLVYEDDQLIGESNEEGVFDYTPTIVGYHELYCKTPEDGDYMDLIDYVRTEITGITVDKRTGSLEVQYDSSTYYIGDTLKINTTFKDEKTGNKVKDRTVKVYNDSTLLGTIENNEQFQYELTSIGELNLKFQFDEDDIYESFTVKDTVDVKKLTPKIYTEPSPIGYTERRVDVAGGFAVRLEYTSDTSWEFPDLPVHVFDDDEELIVGEMNEQGNRMVDWTPATVGDHTIRVVSDESDTYYSAEYTETVTVEKREVEIKETWINGYYTDINGDDYISISAKINLRCRLYDIFMENWITDLEYSVYIDDEYIGSANGGSVLLFNYYEKGVHEIQLIFEETEVYQRSVKTISIPFKSETEIYNTHIFDQIFYDENYFSTVGILVYTYLLDYNSQPIPSISIKRNVPSNGNISTGNLNESGYVSYYIKSIVDSFLEIWFEGTDEYLPSELYTPINLISLPYTVNCEELNHFSFLDDSNTVYSVDNEELELDRGTCVSLVAWNHYEVEIEVELYIDKDNWFSFGVGTKELEGFEAFIECSRVTTTCNVTMNKEVIATIDPILREWFTVRIKRSNSTSKNNAFIYINDQEYSTNISWNNSAIPYYFFISNTGSVNSGSIKMRNLQYNLS